MSTSASLTMAAVDRRVSTLWGLSSVPVHLSSRSTATKEHAHVRSVLRMHVTFSLLLNAATQLRSYGLCSYVAMDYVAM